MLTKDQAIVRHPDEPISKQNRIRPPSNTTLSNLTNKTPNYNYLLLKNLPNGTTKNQLTERFNEYETIEEIIIVTNSNNAYIKFADIEEIREILNKNESEGLLFNNQRLPVCFVNKLPLDLNKKSKIVLVTIYQEKIEINVHSVYDIFKEFGLIQKIIIFKKKNYQVMIEFGSADDALLFKQALHNVNYKGLFFLKIQFTRKNTLVVKSNNIYEYDFTNKKGETEIKNKEVKQEQHKKQTFNMNIVTNLKNLEFDNKKTKTFNEIESLEEDKDKGEGKLQMSNLDANIKHRAIYNLFSLFGSITSIDLFKKQRMAIVTYEKSSSVFKAIQLMNKTQFFSKKVNLCPFKEETDNKTRSYIMDPKIQSPISPLILTKNYTPETKYYQTNQINKNKIVPKPSRVLLISNMSSLIGLKSIEEMFATFEEVINISYLDENNDKAVAVFDDKIAAIKVLAVFKGIKLGDKSIDLNFSSENLLTEGMNQIQSKKEENSLFKQSNSRFTPHQRVKKNEFDNTPFTPQQNIFSKKRNLI